MLTQSVSVNPINLEFHTKEDFKEQVAVLYPAGIEGNYLKVIRSWVGIGSPSEVGFGDGLTGWEWIDDHIENKEVVGIFHTHPQGAQYFSRQDNRMQTGFAKAYGKKLLWHGVQSFGCDQALMICIHMPFAPHVMVYRFQAITSSLEDEVMLLPLPPKIEHHDGDVHSLFV